MNVIYVSRDRVDATTAVASYETFTISNPGELAENAYRGRYTLYDGASL